MATTTAQLSVSDQIRQLEGARKLVLGDVSYYPQVIQATLPIIGPTAQVEFRRWGAEFLSEAFATPAVPLSQKETLSLLVLETLKLLVEDPKQDAVVLRSVIQTAASIYPLAMRWIVNNAYDTTTWDRMTSIKARILQIWENAPPTIRICCIKFAQRVVLAQTPSINPEPRRGDPLDISLVMVPPSHSVLDVQSMEAEASGLLDRMLGVLQDNSSDALIVDATLNTLSILIRNRPATSNRILNAILNFNPLKLANSPMTPRTKVVVRSMEKTTRILLTNLARRDKDPRGPNVSRISQYLDRLMQSRAEILDGASRKRSHVEQDVVAAKRQRTGPAQQELQIPPLGPGPHSLADIFTLTSNAGLRAFDVSLVPAPLAAKISVNTIARTDPKLLDRAINAIRERLTTLHHAAIQVVNPETTSLDVEDDDDYEPDYHEAEDSEQILNKLDSAETSSPNRELQKPAVLNNFALPTFKLPPPPRLNSEQTAKVAQGTVARVFSVMKSLDEPATKKSKAGIHRLAASSYDKESWITVVTRLATRSTAGLDNVSTKEEDGRDPQVMPRLSDFIREALYAHVLEDFRKRIDIAVSWLSEEWYNDRVQLQSAAGSARDVPLHYEKWVLRLLDGFLGYLHAGDKVLTRFLSEIPDINGAVLGRVKTLCRDPSMVSLVITSLLYLVMMRPPVRDLALDVVQDIWTEYDEARPLAGKYLNKWRPDFINTQKAMMESGAPPHDGGGQAVAA